METGQSAGRPRVGAPRRQGAKAQGGAKRPAVATQRVQLHLGAETVRRLGVHCSLVGANNSKTADEILLKWLARFGQGREIFPPLDQGNPADEAESAA